MKRIALLICGLLLLVSNTAEARRNRRNYSPTYSRPVAAVSAPRVASPVAATSATETPASAEATAESSEVATASHTASVTSATTAKTAVLSTATAQGVANIMAAYNRVGHWGGNRGYEGCGCGSTPAAAYNICCYANSGMTTVDVGYARSASGVWYCCRRYR